MSTSQISVFWFQSHCLGTENGDQSEFQAWTQFRSKTYSGIPEKASYLLKKTHFGGPEMGTFWGPEMDPFLAPHKIFFQNRPHFWSVRSTCVWDPNICFLQTRAHFWDRRNVPTLSKNPFLETEGVHIFWVQNLHKM